MERQNKDIHQFSQELNENASTVSSSVSSVKLSINEMIGLVKIQTNELGNISTYIQEVYQDTEQIQQSSSFMKEKINHSQKIIDDSKFIIGEMNQSVRNLKEVFEESMETSENLIEFSDEISKIIHIISDIANQTNVLALNASIKVSKARKYGLGFMVVAEEVKRLAETGAKSTKGISEILLKSKIQLPKIKNK